MTTKSEGFDAIVVGSGPGGATVARELSRRGKRVLILERGGKAPLKEGIVAAASIVSAVSVGDKLTTTRAFTTGGTTAVYFAKANLPPLDVFLALGVDLTSQLASARAEVPLAEVPDELLSVQSMKLRDTAVSLGYSWSKNTMLLDLSKCTAGYTADARWNARSYVQQAVQAGATLVSRAHVVRIIVEGNRAVGVEYKVRNRRKEVETKRVFGTRIVLAAGGTATPTILRDSGMANVAQDGFYIHPCFVTFGMVRGLKSNQSFVGSMESPETDGIALGDGNFDRAFYRMFMLGARQWIRSFRHFGSIGVGVMVKDELSGRLQADGRYHKELSAEDHRKLEKGAGMARQMILAAGGESLYRSPVIASHLGGAIRIQEHLDTDLQTAYRNLHVCDGSVIPAAVMIAPTLTLICLGKYLADRLAPSL